ncbi:MAG: cytochrome c biogenesis CcdA family protein [Jiangellaceae bacterium]
MGELLFGTALLTAFLGGAVALLAPCCVSVMLPAYLASGFRSKGKVLVATLVFAAGVATVIVPIGLGAAAISAALNRHHTLVFSLGGMVMLAAGVATLAGFKPRLPMPTGRSGGRGYAGAYALGAFSGVASACCAPVLAGVALLSGAVASYTAALAVSLTYVAGMVAPLMLLAIGWERGAARGARMLTGRSVTFRAGSVRRRLALGDLLAGLLLAAMGVLAVVLAVTGPSMPTSGWQVRFAADLQHYTAVVTDAFAWVPGWAFAALLIAAAFAVVAYLRRARATAVAADHAPPPSLDPNAVTEGSHER